jgi:hypothetical protein
MTTHRLAHMRANLSPVGLGEPHLTRWYGVRDVLRQSEHVRLRNRYSARAGCQAGGSGSNHDDRLFRPNDPRDLVCELKPGDGLPCIVQDPSNIAWEQSLWRSGISCLPQHWRVLFVGLADFRVVEAESGLYGDCMDGGDG